MVSLLRLLHQLLQIDWTTGARHKGTVEAIKSQNMTTLEKPVKSIILCSEQVEVDQDVRN